MKMKYEICLLCVILICASVCSCDSESDIQPNSNLTISLEMPESPKHVPSYYQAERIYLDTDTLVEYFFAGESPLQPEMENITGEVFYTTQKQLTNHNGGLVSQLPGADAYFGGFDFFYKEKFTVYSTYHIYNFTRRGYPNEIYSQESELDFMTRDKATAEVRSILDQLGLKQMVPVAVLSLDATTLQARADEWVEETNRFVQIASSQGGNPQEEMETYTFTEEEEGYLFYFALERDGFLFCDFDMKMGLSVVPFGRILYGREGVVDASFQDIVDVTEAGEKVEVVSAQSCLDAYIEECNQNLEADPVELTTLGLYYISSGLDEGDRWEFFPVWILEVRSESVNEYGIRVVDHRYPIWDAITGERMA